MANVDNPEAIRFVNEMIRPLSEELRRAGKQVDETIREWSDGKADLFAAATSADDAIEDGRASEGVSRLSGEDIHGFIAVIKALQAYYQGENITSIVYKPAVRPLRID